MRCTLAAGIAALAMVALAGCSSHADATGTTSTSSAQETSRAGADQGTVRGTLLLVGGPAPGAPRPASPGTVTLSGPSVVRVEVDGRGRFETTVGVGRYHSTGTSPLFGSGKYLCQAEHAVVVTSTHTSHVNVYCQMA
jgi:hypothetical protein